MNLTWTNYLAGGVEETRSAFVPAAVTVLAEVIGFELAAELVLKARGEELYPPAPDMPIGRQSPSARRIVALVGQEAAEKLSRQFGGGSFLVPRANDFCCQYLRSKGHSPIQIANKTGLSVRQVQASLKNGRVML